MYRDPDEKRSLATGEKVGGDRITVGDIHEGAIVAIGRGATINITRGLDELPTRYDGRVRSFLEYYLGTPDQPAPFGGRDADLAALDAWLADEDAPPYALLVAPAGRGKSALLAHWVTRLEAREDDTKPHIVYFPVSIRFNTNLETVVFASLAARMAHLYGDQVTEAFDIQQYRGVFSDYLRRVPPDGRQVLVVLNGLDEAAATYIIKIVYQFAGHRSRHPKVWAVSPAIQGDAPHRYADGSLCLYFPQDASWTPAEYISRTIVPWIALWLLFYEIWLDTDYWYGPEAPHTGTK